MADAFFKNPILNSPYAYPRGHWELGARGTDLEGQPTGKIVDARRQADFITPIPKAKKRGKKNQHQGTLALGEDQEISAGDQRYEKNAQMINALRQRVDAWRKLENPNDWKVTPETARLLQHWRHHTFSGIRPFFCQVEAAEVAIWLTEVAPQLGKEGKLFLDYLDDANNEANPGLNRLALKLATGAGKTTVMAMLIAWQTINAIRRPNSKKFTRGFLVVAPGLTIKDRLRVLQPSDPDSYFKNRELIPSDLLPDIQRAKIVITNYHAFKLRERLDVSKGTRSLIEGRTGEAIKTLESEGQMLKRVMSELLAMKNVMVINDEAHHCYREKPDSDEDEGLKGDEKKEAAENAEAARLWISGLEILQEKVGISRVMDLSATPFFLKGSGYAEGTLFPWTMSDFSLMDAIECGIVKLPRVPVADNIPNADVPMFRNLWEHIRTDMPKKGRGKGAVVDPHALPTPLKTALEALYGHYKTVHEAWAKEGISVPPCFIVVCNNTATSKLVYDYISGFERTNDDESVDPIPGVFELFRNTDDNGTPYPRPNTLLIDSHQLESGEGMDDSFKKIAQAEIQQFRNEIIERTGDRSQAENLSDSDLLREVMNTVGKKGKLGESIRCVVSVSMLTEGWDANNVTHILGVRAFGTQLLCEQVIGRALRRQSYDLNEAGKFNAEYADVLGIPFDFTAKPVVSKPAQPRETIHVKAVSPERDAMEIQFPRVSGYRVELPEERIRAKFTDDSTLTITPEMVGATETHNSGIIGETIDLNLVHTGEVRQSQVVYALVSHLLMTKWREPGQPAPFHLFGQLKKVCRQWLDNHLVCHGGTYPAQLAYKTIADRACEKINNAITREHGDETNIQAIIDAYNPVGSSIHVGFNTSKTERWETAAHKCHVNWAILDSDWEGEFCRVAEKHPRVLAYVKNHGLGFDVPYMLAGVKRRYVPDYIVRVDDGHEDPLNLVVEIKGYRGEDAVQKKETMETQWVPGVNNLKTYGRWAFAEFCDVWQMQHDFEKQIESRFDEMVSGVAGGGA